MNFYPFHIGDYASHTRHLSLMEDLAYRRLLDLYYTTERALNGSSTDVARRIGMLAEQAAVEYVLKEFFEPLEDGSGYQNKRCDEEIAKFTAKKVQASQAGKASAERRFNARSTDVQPTKNQEPRTKNQEKKIHRAAKAAKRPLPQDFSISERVKEWATSKGFDRLEEHLEAFRRKCSANSYAYADWDSAFMEAVREDWAKLRLGKQTYDFSKMDI